MKPRAPAADNRTADSAPGKRRTQAPPMRLLTVRDAVERLNVTERTLRAWLAAGKLPAVRLSARCIRIRPEDLEAFIEGRRDDD